jgi:hypothetical protein
MNPTPTMERVPRYTVRAHSPMLSGAPAVRRASLRLLGEKRSPKEKDVTALHCEGWDYTELSNNRWADARW